MEPIKTAFSGSGSMDNTQTVNAEQTSSSGGWGDKVNGALGGGAAGEKNEDYLDKGYGLDQGAQNNESATEQAQDEMISDAIRGGYKSNFGSDFPAADK